MNDLRKMLDEFKHKHVYIQVDKHSAIVHEDNELIHRILSEMVDRIETVELQNSRAEIAKNKN